eukprot:2745333-Amphidinium_carterae.1
MLSSTTAAIVITISNKSNKSKESDKNTCDRLCSTWRPANTFESDTSLQARYSTTISSTNFGRRSDPKAAAVHDIL